MGGQVCGPQKIQLEDPLALNFGLDQKENRVLHSPNQRIVCTNKQIQKILETYQQNLRNQKSLYKDKTIPTDPIILKSKLNEFRCSYQRPYKFLNDVHNGQSYKLVDERDYQPSAIQVKDEVMQYFGVFLCFLADKPWLIKKIICTQENSLGIHCIEAYRDGRISHFFIDDYILCKQSKDLRQKVQPVFSQPIKNIYMWPCILEKAWFKIKGNSAKRVQQNTPQQVFQTFMPLPIQKYYLQDGLNTHPKQVILNAFGNLEGLPKNNGYIIKSKKNPQHDIGLSGGKYFYLLDTFVVDGKRMFYAHNTCGDMVFRGMHDERSPKFKNKLEKWNLTQPTSGDFLLDQDQFVQQMGEILIVHYLPGNKITPYCFQFQNEEEFFLGFDLRYKGIFNLCITQISTGSNKSKAYYPLIYHVIRLNDMKLIGGAQNKQGCFGVKNTYLLDNFNEDSVPGKYLIRLKKKENQHIPNIQLSLIAYYMENIKFQLPSQHELQQKWKQFLRKEGERQLALNNSRIMRSKEIAHVICWLGDVVFLYIENKAQKKDEISVQVNFPQLMNLQCISHPEIRRSDQWISYKIKDYMLIIFEKVDLTAQTHIRQYHLESY